MALISVLRTPQSPHRRWSWFQLINKGYYKHQDQISFSLTGYLMQCQKEMWALTKGFPAVKLYTRATWESTGDFISTCCRLFICSRSFSFTIHPPIFMSPGISDLLLYVMKIRQWVQREEAEAYTKYLQNASAGNYTTILILKVYYI